MRSSKLVILTLIPLAIGVGISPFTATALAQPLNPLEQTAPQLNQPDSAAVEVINFTLPFSQPQTVASLMGQASATARRLIDQAFADNSNVTETQVTILSDRDGEIVPLLVVRVGREDWRLNPRVEQWSWYLGAVAMPLLDTRDRQPPARVVSRRTAPVAPRRPTAAAATSRSTVTSRSSHSTPSPPSSPPTPTNRPSVPISTGTRDDYVMPGMSLEESDPGYR